MAHDRLVCELNDELRVMECAAGIQWILQKRRGSQWKNIAYCRTREALVRIAGVFQALLDLPPMLEAPEPEPASNTLPAAPEPAVDHTGGLKPYVYPERQSNPLHGSNPDGSTPGALQGDDYSLNYDADGNVELPTCLDRRKPKFIEEAA
jgi:hypothetical protein